MSSRLLVLLACVCANDAFAQQAVTDSFAASKAETTRQMQGTATASFQVLGRQEVRAGSHSIIYNRVAPPVIPAMTPSPLLQPQPAIQESLLPPKDCRVIFMSATVVDHQLTLFKQLDGNQTFQAVSNIDFNYLDSIGDIETADAVYTMLLVLGNQTSTDLVANGNTATLEIIAQARQPLLRKASDYVVVAGGPETSACIAALNALHAYYDSHKEQLMRDYRQRLAEKEKAARENARRAPVEPDTVINFWPIKSGVYRMEQSKGGIP